MSRPSAPRPEEPQVLEAPGGDYKLVPVSHISRVSRRARWLVGAVLLSGFVGGYGVGYGVRKREAKQAQAAKPPRPAALAPIVKGLHLSPDGKTLAFTAVYDESRRSSRFVLDVSSGRFSAAESPGGWQDFVLGWDAASRSLLLRRERIPRPVAEATTGFYRQKLLAGEWPRFEPGVSELRPELPRGEKSAFAFWDASGRLIVRTKREPKALFAGGKRLDTSPDLYFQNRTVRENGREALYVVRNSTADIASPPALFRIENGRARRLSQNLSGLEWAYIAERGRWMIAARYAPNNTDWLWTLYKITPTKAEKVREATVPGDVISTYWAPDLSRVLGASGESLWTVEIPSLRTRKVGDEKLANADDAAWSTDSKSVFVAVDGKILRLDLATNQSRELWRFPDQYWD